MGSHNEASPDIPCLYPICYTFSQTKSRAESEAKSKTHLWTPVGLFRWYWKWYWKPFISKTHSTSPMVGILSFHSRISQSVVSWTSTLLLRRSSMEEEERITVSSNLNEATFVP